MEEMQVGKFGYKEKYSGISALLGFIINQYCIYSLLRLPRN